MLEKIHSPQDLKQLKIEQLGDLCQEIREKIISIVDKNGGHLSANLGVVELVVALYYVFDFPKDKIIFDVGHQSYTHKLLTERAHLIETLRKEGGLSGFPNIFESCYDSYTSGHAGSSISAGLGYCYARDTLKEDYYVICLIGDGSLINGVSLEALVNSEEKPEKFLVILNDNRSEERR
jgi:1-deoxy-D-xylulose-5-phosphate synthase